MCVCVCVCVCVYVCVYMCICYKCVRVCDSIYRKLRTPTLDIYILHIKVVKPSLGLFPSI